MALRPRFSPGLPLSNKWHFETKWAWKMYQARQKNFHIIFGGLAVMVIKMTVDP
jgi:hypothetical protein